MNSSVALIFIVGPNQFLCFFHITHLLAEMITRNHYKQSNIQVYC
jgi:hypothetical protein